MRASPVDGVVAVIAVMGQCCGGGEFTLRLNDFRLRWYDPVLTSTTFHQPHDHSEFGFTSRRRPHSPPTSSTRNFSSLTSFSQHTKDISPPLIDILCPKSVGSWSLLVMVLVERSAFTPCLDWDQARSCPMNGILTEFDCAPKSRLAC